MPKLLWPVLFLFLAAGETIQIRSPETILWAGPGILFASLAIAWAAESSQFFIAQGFALAILAWMQTLPEFAGEAVLAWHRQVPYLFAALTGALRLLTGLGWPMIYFAAATVYRRREGKPLNRIVLAGEHSVGVVGLLAAMVYIGRHFGETLGEPVRRRGADGDLRGVLVVADQNAVAGRRRHRGFGGHPARHRAGAPRAPHRHDWRLVRDRRRADLLHGRTRFSEACSRSPTT